MTTPPIVVLPASCVNEVKSLPESKVSMMEDIRRVFTSSVTHIGEDTEEIIPAIKNDLTRHITSVFDDLQEEVRYAFDTEFGPCRDWTPQPLYAKITRVVALLSGRVFVGRPLSRREDWLQSTISYTFNCMKARDACNRWPAFARPIVGHFLPEIRALRQQRANGAQALGPILEDILSRQEQGHARQTKLDLGAFEDEQGTMCSWILKYTAGARRNQSSLANNQMGCK